MAKIQDRILQVVWSKNYRVNYILFRHGYQFTDQLNATLNKGFSFELPLIIVLNVYNNTKALRLPQQVVTVATISQWAWCQMLGLRMLLLVVSQLVSDTNTASFMASTN